MHFLSNLDNINLRNFHNHGELYKFQRKLNKVGERCSSKESIAIREEVSLRLIQKDLVGNQQYVRLPFS